MIERVSLGYGSGGRLSRELFDAMISPRFTNPALDALGDAAILNLPSSKIAFTTDSFVVSPLFFPGGDIGKLSICGTVNDLAVSFAQPLYISCSLILEEGLEFSVLEQILDSMQKEAEIAGVQIVTGDTKVVEHGSIDKIFINSAGIGIRIKEPAPLNIGDAVLLSGDIGDHGVTVFSLREGFEISGDLKSDAAPLSKMIRAVLDECDSVSFMRDATRGGVSSALNELAISRNCSILLYEDALPISDPVRAFCDMVGFDPLYVANEGKLVMTISQKEKEKALSIMRSFAEGRNAAEVGEVTSTPQGKVMLRTSLGVNRVVEMLRGAQLPRIC